ncbi:MAG: hypothetical protein K2X11_04020 [Acetobacteraceae bacterium]|nr:hypothetical protein [Acetobacteraceae bacterium]
MRRLFLPALIAAGLPALAAAQPAHRAREATPRLDTRPPSIVSLATGNNRLGTWPNPAFNRGPAYPIPQATLSFLCPHGGTPQRGGRCRPGRGGMDGEVAGWHRDLRPATMAQTNCPPGTMQTEARFNPGVTRCLPAEPPARPAAIPSAGPTQRHAAALDLPATAE